MLLSGFVLAFVLLFKYGDNTMISHFMCVTRKLLFFKICLIFRTMEKEIRKFS